MGLGIYTKTIGCDICSECFCHGYEQKCLLPSPVAPAACAEKTKTEKKNNERHVKKSQSLQNDACKTLRQKLRPEGQDYPLCSSLYLAGIDKSQASILTIHITVHDACP